MELKEYLEKYLQLRTFNLAWLSHVQKQAKEKSERGRSIKQIVELLATIDPTKELQPKEENYLKFNNETFSFFRRKNSFGLGCFKIRDSKDNDEIFILKNIALIGTKKEQLFTWNAIQYIVNNPPCLSLIGNNVKLTDSTSIKLSCNTLFTQIGETCELYKQSGDTDFTSHDRDFSFSPSDFMGKSLKASSLLKVGDSDIQLNLDTIIKFMPTEAAIKFINSYDLAGHGYINLHMFMRNVAGITKLRTDLINNLLKNVVTLVQRLIYAILWLILLVFAGLVVRINSNIVLPSTIGIVSTSILALSYLYTKLITAIIFVVLSCPYHVGDRVRVNDSEPMFVKRIRTYTTEFRCIHGKIVIYQNSNLSNMTIINETRSNPAFIQFDMNIGASVNAAVLKALKQNISDYVSSRPMEYVKNSCEFFGMYLEPGHLYRLTIRAQCTRGWVEACNIKLQNRSLCDFIMHQCKVLGITYHSPQRNIRFSTPLTITKQ